MELLVKSIMIILGFWIPAILLDALKAESAEEALNARGKLCVGCGLFVILLIFLI